MPTYYRRIWKHEQCLFTGRHGDKRGAVADLLSSAQRSCLKDQWDRLRLLWLQYTP